MKQIKLHNTSEIFDKHNFTCKNCDYNQLCENSNMRLTYCKRLGWADPFWKILEKIWFLDITDNT